MSEEPSLEQAEALLSSLVACPSVNPARRDTFESPFGEAALTEMLRDRTEQMGAAAELVDVSPRRPNLIAHFKGADSSRSLMLEAHSDTVSVEGFVGDPFDPVIRDGKLYGRGACDTKGPMAAMLLGIESVLASDGQPPVDVYFVSACDEESGGTGAKALMASGFRPDAAVVAEPTEMKLIHTSKGIVRFCVETLGKAAHTSRPELGLNAIYHMAHALRRIEQDLGRELAGRRHPLLGAPTICVSVIHGGSQVNVVPDTCHVEIDRRLIPDETAQQAEQELRDVLLSVARDVDDLQFALSETQFYPAFEQELECDFVQTAAGACRAVLGEAEFSAVHYGSDAGVYKAHGVPSLILGPGSIRQAHTKEEFIELEQVVTAARIYAEIIRSFAA